MEPELERLRILLEREQVISSRATTIEWERRHALRAVFDELHPSADAVEREVYGVKNTAGDPPVLRKGNP